MKKILSVLVLIIFISGMSDAQNQTAKPLIIHKAHVKENKQLNKNLKTEKLFTPLSQQNKKVIQQPRKKIPYDNSVRIQKNSVKTPVDN
jgi:hypothetical protein